MDGERGEEALWNGIGILPILVPIAGAGRAGRFKHRHLGRAIQQALEAEHRRSWR